MKKLILLGICLYIVPVLFAQDEQKQGDEMAAGGNFSGAAMMYRICMEQEEPCVLKLFKLIYDEKIEPESTDELYQLISPLAGKGNAEAQFYLGELYRKGIGGVALDYHETMKWLQKSSDQDYADARSELEAMSKRLSALGDDMVIAGKYNEAAAMYRLCFENEELSRLKLFKLIYEKKTEALNPDEPYQLISPLAEKGNAEAQYYLGVMFRTGLGVSSANDTESLKWFQLSADQGNENAQDELKALQKEPVAPPAQTVTTPPSQTVFPPVKEANDKKSAIDNLQYKPSKSKLPGVLLVAGGIGIAAGAATYFLLPKTAEDVFNNRDYSETTESNPYYKLPKERNPVYLIAGCAAGGVCIGTGIVIKSKDKKRLISENYSLQPLSRPDDVMRLNVVATNNGAGLRLTF